MLEVGRMCMKCPLPKPIEYRKKGTGISRSWSRQAGPLIPGEPAKADKAPEAPPWGMKNLPNCPKEESP